MMPAYNVILSKMGLNKKTQRIFRFVPTSLGGLGLPHLYIIQGIAHIMAMMTHCSKDTQIGLMLIAQLELSNIEIGSADHLFDIPFKEYSPLLTDCWMKSTWCFQYKHDIMFVGPYDKPKIQRVGD